MKKLAALMLIAAVGGAAEQAQFTKDNQLVRPDNYREWIFLSSGLGMTYGPNAPAAGSNLRFDNVYVNPSSYRQFLKSGRWPDGTILILEVRESQSKGSINQHGHYQTSLVGLEANVKDSRRFPDNGWAFFNLGATGPRTVKAIAPGNGCQKCHDQNGAVDSTFVQFYPDLVPVAKKFGTFKPAPVSGVR